MHNTTTGFYPQKFGDRVPTRGDLQSRCGRNGRTKIIPSAQGQRRVNSRADNSLGRVKQQQMNTQAQKIGGTHYGNMFKDHSLNPLLSDQPEPPRNISLNRRLDDNSELDLKANFDQKGSIAINI